ncbi:hypothetical protein ACVWWN_003405 [Mycobacterium sp. URHB0021]
MDPQLATAQAGGGSGAGGDPLPNLTMPPVPDGTGGLGPRRFPPGMPGAGLSGAPDPSSGRGPLSGLVSPASDALKQATSAMLKSGAGPLGAERPPEGALGQGPKGLNGMPNRLEGGPHAGAAGSGPTKAPVLPGALERGRCRGPVYHKRRPALDSRCHRVPPADRRRTAVADNAEQQESHTVPIKACARRAMAKPSWETPMLWCLSSAPIAAASRERKVLGLAMRTQGRCRRHRGRGGIGVARVLGLTVQVHSQE